VIDPTWRDAKNAAYFGAAFNRDFMIDFVTTYTEYGILESDYRQEHKFKIEGFPTGATNYGVVFNRDFVLEIGGFG
jgi:hypothetical protein